MRLIAVVCVLLGALTLAHASQLPAFVSGFSNFFGDLVSYNNNCGQPRCPSVPVTPPAGYNCDCSRVTEHPDCGCPNTCDCTNPQAHPACGCLVSIPLPSSSNTCLKGPCGDMDDGVPALPFSPPSSAPLPLPPMHPALCRPNVADVGPGTCRRGTANDLCSATDSNCAPPCLPGHTCFSDATTQSCTCAEPAPAPCNCIEQQQQQQLQQQLQQQQQQLQQQQQQYQQQQYQQQAPQQPFPQAPVQQPYAPQAPAAPVAQAPPAAPVAPAAAPAAPVAPAVTAAPAAHEEEHHEEHHEEEHHEEEHHEEGHAPETHDIQAFEAAREAALKAQEAVRTESENLKQQQESLKKEAEHIEELEKRLDEKMKQFNESSQAQHETESHVHEEESQFVHEESEVSSIETKAKELLEEIKHEAEEAESHVSAQANPEAHSKIEFDRHQLDQLAASIDKLTEETKRVEAEHVHMQEMLHSKLQTESVSEHSSTTTLRARTA